MTNKSLAGRSIEIIKREGVGEFLRRAGMYVFVFLPRYWRALVRPRHSIKDELRYRASYLRRPSREVVREIQGSRMLLNLRDQGIHKDLFLYGKREPECTRLVQQELRKGMKIVDIGANIGYYVLMEAKIVGDSGKIYAIEPEPANFEVLKKNVAMNSYTGRVEPLMASVGDKNEASYLLVSSQANLHKIATPEQVRQNTGKLIKVDMVSLDRFLEGKEAGFVRMDVEGYEYFIIRGMERIFREGRPLKMLIEVHTVGIKNRGGDVDEFLQRLAAANLSLKYFVTAVRESALKSFLGWFIGKGLPAEVTVRYDRPLKALLEDSDVNHLLKSTPGYSLFLER